MLEFLKELALRAGSRSWSLGLSFSANIFHIQHMVLKKNHQASLPESTETLAEWKLPNSDNPFGEKEEKEFLDGIEQHAAEANDLFWRALETAKNPE